MPFTLNGVAGANLSASTSIQRFALGTIAQGTDKSEWVYVYASGAIAHGSGVQISTTGTAALWTPTALATGSELAFAQYAFADGEYGWVAKRGNSLTVRVSATSTLQATLYASATSGALTTTATSGSLAGIALLTASTTAAVATNLAVVTWPKCTGAGN